MNKTENSLLTLPRVYVVVYGGSGETDCKHIDKPLSQLISDNDEL
jgi:hypothetical protein